MADDEDPKAGELTTTNYHWTKPTVGASDDQWGGYLNADLDGIDGTVKSVSNVANAAYPASNPAGYITAAAIPAPYVLPIASTTVLGGVKVDGTTIHAAGDGTLSGTPSSGPPVTISDTPPVGPQIGALWWDSVGGQLYTFYNDGNSSQWVIAVNAAALLLPASTTVLGGVKVDGTTITAAVDGTITAHAGTGENRLINGDMRIDHRNNGAATVPIAGAYVIDRWAAGLTQAGKFNAARYTAAVGGTLPALGYNYYLGIQSTSAYAVVASDQFSIRQPIEADLCCRFCLGNFERAAGYVVLFGSKYFSWDLWRGDYQFNNRRNALLSVLLFASGAGAGWTKITITIPGDTAGTWMLQGNGVGVALYLGLGVGSTYSRSCWGMGGRILL